jgi:hypothetical protein
MGENLLPDFLFCGDHLAFRVPAWILGRPTKELFIDEPHLSRCVFCRIGSSNAYEFDEPGRVGVEAKLYRGITDSGGKFITGRYSCAVQFLRIPDLEHERHVFGLEAASPFKAR